MLARSASSNNKAEPSKSTWFRRRAWPYRSALAKWMTVSTPCSSWRRVVGALMRPVYGRASMPCTANARNNARPTNPVLPVMRIMGGL
jgi:hypothetical protein